MPTLQSTLTPHAIHILLNRMERKLHGFPLPMSNQIVEKYGKDPYLILISCLLSLRSRDPVTYAVSQELFNYAKTPQEMIKLPLTLLEKILKPIGFYRRKAAIIKEVSKELLERFEGEVPSTQEELLSLKHVGRKTANLVVGMAFDVPALCVDTHVHRIAHHLGLVNTKTPEQTEYALMDIVPKNDWVRLNKIFVMWGQNICKPMMKECACYKALGL